jgi:transposase
LPNDARASLIVLTAQLHALQTTIGALEKRITVQHRANKESKRLQTIPGIGVIGASAIAATVTNPKIFRSGRDFGDRYLRRILVLGAVSTLRRAKLNPKRYPWVTRLLARRPFKVVAVALANKMARIAWALMISGKTCRSAWFAAA